MRHAPRAVIGVTLLALLAVSGCIGGGSSPSGSPTSGGTGAASSPAATGLPAPVAQTVFQTSESVSNSPGLFVTTSVYGVYRQGSYATLVFGMGYTGDFGGQSPNGLPSVVNAPYTKEYAPTGVALVDPAARKAYLPGRTADGKCFCSSTLTLLGSGPNPPEGIARATFAAPPSGARSIDVYIPHAGVLPNVPVTDGPPPVASTPAPGSSPSTKEASPPPPTGTPARADVVDLTMPVANLDKSVTQERDKLLLAADVLFKFDKATLTPQGKARVADAAAILRKRAKNMVKVDGYTDSKGSDAYNQRLSQRRAATVEAALQGELGGSGLTFTAKGFGESNPVARNDINGADNPKGRALNRRVEVLYEPKTPSPTPTPTGTTSSSAASGGPSGPTGAPTPGQVIASRDITKLGQYPVDMQAQVFRLYRHGSLVTMDFGLKNTGTNIVQITNSISRDQEFNVSGVALADVPGKKLYLAGSYPLQTGKNLPNSCACTTFPYAVGAQQTAYLTATFAAPPAGQDKIDVRLPGVKPIKDVPITG